MGAISSTTILANMVGEDDLQKIAALGNISTGLHFNMLDGKPVSPPEQVYSLIDPSGNFFSLNVFLSRYMLKKIRLDHIEMELHAQLNVLKQNHINVSHADSHKHIHQFPFIGKIIQELFVRNGIRRVRNCRVTDESNAKTALYRGVWEIARLENKKLISPETLITSFWSTDDKHEAVFKSSISKAYQEYSVVEFMTHPATANKPGSKLNRKAEYEFWKSMKWKEILDKENIRVTNYSL